MLVYEQADRVVVKNNLGRDIQPGEIVQIGNWIGMAYAGILNGEEGVLVIRGVVEAPVSDPTAVISSGEKLQFDPNSGKVSPYDSNSSNPVIGKAFVDKPAGVDTVQVVLMPELY
jgi:predicted RecA/RadA family phage recombinase